ncbi:hypothetical protein [Enterococcus gilvus]|uniref:hypothetical protein n=1 Tax=Enterococcus gilvus TaxID=160453 RepID=UPI0039F44F53
MAEFSAAFFLFIGCRAVHKKIVLPHWFNRAVEQAKKIDEEFQFNSFSERLNYSIMFPMFKPKYMKQSKSEWSLWRTICAKGWIE